MSKMRGPPKSVRIETIPPGAFLTADNTGITAVSMLFHSRDERLRQFCRDNCYQLSFVRDVKRVEAKYLTSAFYFLLHRDEIFLDLYTDFRAERDLIECRRKAAARRIT